MVRSEMMERMPSSEFEEWKILYQIEPFGDKRGDIQAALIAQTVANMLRDPKAKAYPLDMFLLSFEPKPKPKPQTAEQIMQIMLIVQAQQNAQSGTV